MPSPRLRLFVSVLLLTATASACASYTALTDDDRGRIERELTRSDVPEFLKLSFYVTPFFGDQGKRLLTPLPPAEVRLLDDTSGNPIPPGDIETVLPAGTPVVIDRIEFPTSLVVTGRIVYTPRTRAWVYLHVPGAAKAAPLILVLRPGMKTEADVRAEIERYLTTANPAPTLAQWPKSIQHAIARKQALLDMPQQALEMAWGYPATIHRDFQEVGRKEVWTYPGGRRKAVLLEGRVVDLAQGP